MKRILIFSGTTEGRTLSEILCDNGIPHLVSVATEYGRQLSPEHSCARVIQGRMNADDMCALLADEQIELVIDATHPYAVEVTENIRQAVRERTKQGQAVAYMRYVRETDAGRLIEDDLSEFSKENPSSQENVKGNRVQIKDILWTNQKIGGNADKLHYFRTVEECERALHDVEGNIMLTTGSKELAVFCQSEGLKRRLIVRILPSAESIALCERQGLLGRQIIAMQGPFSEELNLALIRQYRVSCMVTKQSGHYGGFAEKVAAARTAGIPLYVIGTPVQETGDTLEEILREIGIAGRNSSIVGKDDYTIGDSEWFTQENSEPSVHRNSELSADREAGTSAHEDSDDSETSITDINMNIQLIGCGMGAENTLTVAAKQSIEQADILLGAERLIRPYTARLEKKAYYLARDIIPYLQEIAKKLANHNELLSGRQQITREHGIHVESHEKNQTCNRVLQVVILFSGDTGFYSGCEKLYSALDEAVQKGELSAELTILPGISSVAYLASRVHTSWDDAAIMSVHGRGDVSNWREELIHTVQEHEKTYLLVSHAKDVADVYRILQELVERAMCTECQLYAGYQLSYPEERMMYYEISSSKDGEMLEYNDLPEGLYICLIRSCI